MITGRPQAPGLRIDRWVEGAWSQAGDAVAAEEPLQLLLNGAPLSILMRTPGNDIELGLGLLFGERVIRSLEEVLEVRISAEAGEEETRVLVRPDLVEANHLDFALAPGARHPERSLLQNSACGVCGATTLESLALELPTLPPGPSVDPAVLPQLAVALRQGQALFEATGGLHAAALFEPDGTLVCLREDIGRHNAVDKVVGRALLDDLRTSSLLLAVSGRGGYELVQKAVAAGVPLLAAVGAPSSLAVAVARRFGLTLVGFLRDGRFNVYSAPQRLRSAP